jgi:hypothetical protein
MASDAALVCSYKSWGCWISMCMTAKQAVCYASAQENNFKKRHSQQQSRFRNLAVCCGRYGGGDMGCVMGGFLGSLRQRTQYLATHQLSIQHHRDLLHAYTMLQRCSALIVCRSVFRQLIAWPWFAMCSATWVREGLAFWCCQGGVHVWLSQRPHLLISVCVVAATSQPQLRFQAVKGIKRQQ